MLGALLAGSLLQVAAVPLGEPLVLGPKWSGPARVAPIELELNCVDDACKFSVHARVTKHGKEPLVGAIWVGGAHVTVDVDKAEAVAPAIVPPELENYDPKNFRSTDPALARPIAFVVGGPAGSTHDVLVAGMVPTRLVVRSLPERFVSASALEARHVLLADPPRIRGAAITVVTPAETIDGGQAPNGIGYQGVIRAKAPPDWRFENRGDRACPSRVAGLDVGCAAPAEETHEGSTELYAAPLGRDLVLSMRAAAPPEPRLVGNGGPLLGIGGAIGADGGFRVRGGWEVGLGGSGAVLGSLTADSDLAKRVVIAPLVSGATRTTLVRPSFGVGVGVPVEVAPERRVGPRLQLDAHWFAIGLVGFVDVLFGPGPPRANVSILGEAAF
jgi:hypothetical protein